MLEATQACETARLLYEPLRQHVREYMRVAEDRSSYRREKQPISKSSETSSPDVAEGNSPLTPDGQDDPVCVSLESGAHFPARLSSVPSDACGMHVTRSRNFSAQPAPLPPGASSPALSNASDPSSCRITQILSNLD